MLSNLVKDIIFQNVGFKKMEDKIFKAKRRRHTEEDTGVNP